MTIVTMKFRFLLFPAINDEGTNSFVVVAMAN